MKTVDGCDGNEDKTFHIDIEIPPTVPTENTMSKIIAVTYLIRVSLFLPQNWIVGRIRIQNSYPFVTEIMSLKKKTILLTDNSIDAIVLLKSLSLYPDHDWFLSIPAEMSI